jgi:hypothetical protein
LLRAGRRRPQQRWEEAGAEVVPWAAAAWAEAPAWVEAVLVAAALLSAAVAVLAHPLEAVGRRPLRRHDRVAATPSEVAALDPPLAPAIAPQP